MSFAGRGGRNKKTNKSNVRKSMLRTNKIVNKMSQGRTAIVDEGKEDELI